MCNALMVSCLCKALRSSMLYMALFETQRRGDAKPQKIKKNLRLCVSASLRLCVDNRVWCIKKQ